MKAYLSILSVCWFFVINVSYAGEIIAEPDAYKMDEYRSPTPNTLFGATVVDARQAKILHENGQIKFIDVLPSPKQPPGMKEGDVWLPKKRFNIPQSIWLADVGFGVLSDEIETYFIDNLTSVAEKYQGMLFYCQIDCWMSWNAAKRALSYGYSNVYWFPGGVDEWSLNDYPLMESKVVEIKH